MNYRPNGKRIMISYTNRCFNSELRVKCGYSPSDTLFPLQIASWLDFHWQRKREKNSESLLNHNFSFKSVCIIVVDSLMSGISVFLAASIPTFQVSRVEGNDMPEFVSKLTSLWLHRLNRRNRENPFKWLKTLESVDNFIANHHGKIISSKKY